MKCTECKVGYCAYRSTGPQRECPIQNGHRYSFHFSMPPQESGKGPIVPEGTRMVIDWPSFRREIAMKMLPVTATMKITKDSATVRMISKEGAARLAIEYADELIKQLKQE